jgi:hypothetical protein
LGKHFWVRNFHTETLAQISHHRYMIEKDPRHIIGAINKLPKNVKHKAIKSSYAASRAASTGEDHAGATLNVNTFHLAKQGEPLYIVGGEKDTAGNGIETKFEGGGQEVPRISPLSILQHAGRVRTATGGRQNANLGLWLPPRDDAQRSQGIQVDASAGFGTKEDAITAMSTRPAEMGGWDNEKGEFFENPAYDETKDPKSPNYKG